MNDSALYAISAYKCKIAMCFFKLKPAEVSSTFVLIFSYLVFQLWK